MVPPLNRKLIAATAAEIRRLRTLALRTLMTTPHEGE